MAKATRLDVLLTRIKNHNITSVLVVVGVVALALSRRKEATMDTTSSHGPPTHIVQLSYRYRAAWGEIGTRIAQRQNALQIYVTLATGILAVIFTGRPLQLDNAGYKINPNVFFFLLPIVSLTFAFLNFKHERTIAILRQFLTACETVNNSHSNPLPNYHGDEKYYKSAKRVRNWHDYASILLIIVFNAIGGWVASEAFPQLATVTWPNLLLSGLYDVMVLSACLLVGLQPSED